MNNTFYRGHCRWAIKVVIYFIHCFYFIFFYFFLWGVSNSNKHTHLDCNMLTLLNWIRIWTIRLWDFVLDRTRARVFLRFFFAIDKNVHNWFALFWNHFLYFVLNLLFSSLFHFWCSIEQNHKHIWMIFDKNNIRFRLCFNRGLHDILFITRSHTDTIIKNAPWNLYEK